MAHWRSPRSRSYLRSLRRGRARGSDDPGRAEVIAALAGFTRLRSRERQETLAIDVHTSHGRERQVVYVAAGEVRASPVIVFAASIRAAATLSPAQALIHNATMAFGAITIDQGQYVLRHIIRTTHVSADDIRWYVELLAHEAARLRSIGEPTPADARDLLYPE